jgi:hypothetical protein
MAGLVLGDLPEPKIPEGWVRVKVTHPNLNRHDIFTLRGVTSHAEGITYCLGQKQILRPEDYRVTGEARADQNSPRPADRE